MVKLLLAGSIILVLAVPAMAAKTVYLKEGGTLRAMSVWQTSGKVHVLVNRDTLAEFASSEIDLKRTFPRKHRQAKKTVEPAAATVSAKPVSSGGGLQLPGMPKLTDKKPENLLPKAGEGTIRKHKKEMADKAGE